MLFSLKGRKKDDKSQDSRKNSKIDEFGDDLDFPDSPIRKPTGRGERKQEMGLDFMSDFSPEFSNSSAIPVAPPRARKTAGWGEDTPGKKSWLRRGSKHFTQTSPKKEIMTDTSPMTAEIPVIPDLDTMKDEELSADIAKAPNLAVSRIATYQELDSDLSKHAAFQALDGIDLTLLTKRLLPEHVVKKEDEIPWTWDTLFADVSSQLNAKMSQDSNETTVAEK
ncbi:intraflagellar transport protein 43 homolog [Parasteatoda tepidariorum]|uniref:intraflagellar transport protein 43 homolog n=1 Tax=Parasteatoda tepidariorum TaxID=114398 RepID=UPI00077FD7EB|nr:intraflagellar transport protein 43 homolog [Parasteatoda tepidariorum]